MLTGPEARRLADALRGEIRVLRSMLQEAEDGKAWEACGHDRPGEWVVDLFDGDLCLPLVGNLAAIPGRTVQARVSRPGATVDARPTGVRDLGRTEVTPYWKGSAR